MTEMDGLESIQFLLEHFIGIKLTDADFDLGSIKERIANGGLVETLEGFAEKPDIPVETKLALMLLLSALRFHRNKKKV